MNVNDVIQAFMTGFALYAGLYCFCAAVHGISRAFVGSADV